MTARHYGSSAPSRGIGARRKREIGIGWGWVENQNSKNVEGTKKEKATQVKMRESVAGEILYTCHSLPGSTIPVVEKC